MIVLWIKLELQDFKEPEEQMVLMALQDTLGGTRKQLRQERKESQVRMELQLHTTCDHPQKVSSEDFFLMFQYIVHKNRIKYKVNC